MTWESIWGPAVVAAFVSGIVSIVSAVLNTRLTRRLHQEKLEFDRDQAIRKADADIELGQRRADADIALTERKFALDRQMAAWKRRTDLAEEALADFHQARDLMLAARSPAGFGDEGHTRIREDWETDSDSRLLDSYFRTVERLNGHEAFFSQMMARRHRMVALFGREAVRPYEDFHHIRIEIFTAVRMLVSTYRNQPGGGANIADRQSWQRIIGWTDPQQDPILPRLDDVVHSIEAICRPVLQAPLA